LQIPIHLRKNEDIERMYCGQKTRFDFASRKERRRGGGTAQLEEHRKKKDSSICGKKPVEIRPGRSEGTIIQEPQSMVMRRTCPLEGNGTTTIVSEKNWEGGRRNTSH